MGQQLSAESYCQATIQKLANELNTSDSRVGESRVTVGGEEEENQNWHIAFAWREWVRVSKYVERILPNSEQKRLLQQVLLRHTGLDSWQAGDSWDAASGLQVSADSRWSVHLNYGDDTGTNAVLYKDFVKVHFQLDPLFDNSRLSSRDSGLSLSTGEEQSDSLSQLVERMTDHVKRQCSRIGINLLVTNAQYHCPDNCLVVSGTIDIRSILRNSGGVELRSSVNYSAASDQELSDQFQRSVSGLRERLARQAEQQAPEKFFPMSLHYCEDTKRVTLAYSAQPAEVPNT